jgi:glucose-6-phosphate isomerase
MGIQYRGRLMSEALAAHARSLANANLADLFARDRSRVARLAREWGDWHVDFSKERLTPSALEALLAHAESIGVPQWIDALFAGERVNLSEERPALHSALRQQDDTPIRVGGEDVIPAIRSTQRRMRAIADSLRTQGWRGATDQPIRNVVSIGIGGSDLGPRLVCTALDAGDESPLRVSFVSNVDPEALSRTLAPLDAATTLFVVISKTFTTQETLANAQAARRWLERSLGGDVSRHFIGVTANVAQARAFGIVEDNILPMWDWVGGRYSLWSAVGLPIAIACGYPTFESLLAGAAAMDKHVRTTPLERNLAAILGLVGWWNARWLGFPQRLVIPYAHALRELPSFLQQLSLESNGKRVTRDGMPLQWTSAPGLWGGTGTDSQHSFFQWLHQGTHSAPVEFVVPVRSRHPIGNQQTLLVANALAQAQALLVGRSAEQVRRELAGQGFVAHEVDMLVAARVSPGNRGSTTLLLPVVDAWQLGALLALYEHRTYVESLLWQVNAFDQWGVELGKTLAKPIASALAGEALLPIGTDASTEALVAQARRLAQSE